MRLHIPNVLTAEEADELIKLYGSGVGTRLLKNNDLRLPIINRIVRQVREHVPVKLSGRTNVRVEATPNVGITPHYDGCKKKDGEYIRLPEGWCHYSATILLSHPDSFSGGWFEILEPEPVERWRDEAYLSIVIWTGGMGDVPVKHWVTPHEGKRYMLLMFFEGLKRKR